MYFMVVLFAKPNNVKWSAVVRVMCLGFCPTRPTQLAFDGLVLERIVENDVSRSSQLVLLLPLFGCPLVCGLPFWCCKVRFMSIEAQLTLCLIASCVTLLEAGSA